MMVVNAGGGGGRGRSPRWEGVVARSVQRYPLAYVKELRVGFSLRPKTRLLKDDQLCPFLVTSINC